jgi:autophagy-related protein 16
MAMLEEIHRKILARNALETTPFLSVYASNATLLNQLDSLQSKCDSLERDLAAAEQKEQQDDVAATPSKAANAALKNDARLRDKVEKLQQELNDKLRVQADDTARALRTAQDLAESKDRSAAQEREIVTLNEEKEKAQKAIEHLTEQVADAQATTKLAELQYNGLKETIRILQNENDELKKENRMLIDRTVNDAEKTSDEINILNEMVEKLKMEVDMLRSLKVQEEKRKSWFGRAAVNADHEMNEEKKAPPATHRQFGAFGVILPSEPKHTIKAHGADCSGLRYDGSGADLVASASSDNTVKVWDTSNGLCRATLRGGSGHAMTCCDIGGGFAVGGSTDKTCRVWNLRTERMVSSKT